MQKKAGILFLLAFAAITISGFCTPVNRSINDRDKQALVFENRELPNAELDRQHSSGFVYSHSAEKKASGLTEQPFRFLVPVLKAVRLAGHFITSFPEKDYLFYIYPTHNFW